MAPSSGVNVMGPFFTLGIHQVMPLASGAGCGMKTSV